MVYIYLADSRLLPDPAGAAAFAAEQGEAEGAAGFAPMLARKERWGARLLLKAIFPRFGADPSAVYYGEKGKPYVNGLYFNFSHSGGRVALAVSSAPVGCDIELIRRAPVRVERKFTQSEREYLSRFTGAERDRVFFALWTAKESYLKMTGEGLGALSAVAVDTAENALVRGDERQKCFLRRYDGTDYVLTVCAEEGEFSAPETVKLTATDRG